MIKKLLTVAVLGLSTMSWSVAWAHGEAKAKHGGVVAMAADLEFELVGAAGGAVIYVTDHGKPMAPAGIAGKLTVLNGSVKSEAALVAAGDRLEAKGVSLGAGAKAVAALTMANRKSVTVRFSIK